MPTGTRPPRENAKAMGPMENAQATPGVRSIPTMPMGTRLPREIAISMGRMANAHITPTLVQSIAMMPMGS